MKRVLVDTGPIVAVMVAQDVHHQSCVDVLRELPGAPVSCWPVVTEAAWLLRDHPVELRKLLSTLSTGFIEMLLLLSTEAGRIGEIMDRYSNLRPQLADAALVYLAERENIDTIFTLDRRDFSVYRIAGKRPFRIIPAAE